MARNRSRRLHVAREGAAGKRKRLDAKHKITKSVPEEPPSIERKYAPCNPSSSYHDLRCGHRIKTRGLEPCGASCSTPNQGEWFICPECVIGQVRLQCSSQELSAKDGEGQETGEADTWRTGNFKAFAEKRVAYLVGIGYRLTEAAPKLEPILQFFNEFPEAQTDGGLISDPTKRGEAERTLKRPGRGSFLNKHTDVALARALPATKQKLPGKLLDVNEKSMMRSREAHKFNPTSIEDAEIENLFRLAHSSTRPHPKSHDVAVGASLAKHPESNSPRRRDLKTYDSSDHPLEDEATKAVRKVLATLSLKYASGKSG